jgi:hypothetical protein
VERKARDFVHQVRRSDIDGGMHRRAVGFARAAGDPGNGPSACHAERRRLIEAYLAEHPGCTMAQAREATLEPFRQWQLRALQTATAPAVEIPAKTRAPVTPEALEATAAEFERTRGWSRDKALEMARRYHGV